MATADTADTAATADMTATSGHVNDHDDSNRRRRRATATADTADTAATSRHVDDIDSDKTTMNTMMATDGITVADTMTTGTVTTGMTTSGSSGINVAPTAIPTSIVARPRGGPIAFLEDRAAMLSQRADETAAFAREAVTNAQDFSNAYASIIAKHRKMFLGRAFGIAPDGTVIELKKEFKSVKTYEKYNDMIHMISNWGDNAFLKEASFDADPVAHEIRKFCKSNPSGYNYVRDFKIEVAETLDESQRLILKHKKSGGIVQPHAQHL
jgi:hypothetical protein